MIEHAIGPAEGGFVHDMPDQAYHADPIAGGSLSSTFARLLGDHVPAKAKAIRDHRKPTRAMDLGKAVHRRALGTGPDLIVWEYDGRTKAGKAEREAAAPRLASEEAVAVTAEERDQVDAMVEALRSHREVVELLDRAAAEVSAFWRDGPVWCRARYDLLDDEGAWDYKTARDVTRRGFSKALAAFGYHQQADWYLRGLQALGHPAGRRPFRFVCQESDPPYLVQIHRADDEAMWAASELNSRALRIYADAQRTGVWPGYPTLTADPTPLPAFYWTDHEGLLDMEITNG